MCENVLCQFLSQDIPLVTFTIYFTCPRKQHGYDNKLSAYRNRVSNPPTSDTMKRLKITSHFAKFTNSKKKSKYVVRLSKASGLKMEPCRIRARNRRKCGKNDKIHLI